MGNLYDDAKDALDKLFGDKSYSIEEAIVNFQTLSDEIDIYIEALKSDLGQGD